jgi:hypothetical protein
MVFKTRLKRFEFGSTVIMIAFFAVLAGIMLLSGYGWTCVASNPSAWGVYSGGKDIPGPPIPPYDFGYIAYEQYLTFGTLMQVFYAITWILPAVWGFVIYSFLTNRKWSYWLAVGTAITSFVIGLIPALISDTNGFTFSTLHQIPYADPPLPGNWVEAFEFEIGAHWSKVFASLMVLILVLPYPRSPIKRSLQSFSSTENKWGTGVARQLTMMSMFFFFLAILSFLGSGFMKDAHIIGGISVWEMVEIQIAGGIVTTVAGTSMLSGGLILHYIRRPSSLTKPL